MPSSFVARSGLSLARTPSRRQQAVRRRLALLCALVALAIASGVVGSLVRPAPPVAPERVATGPFSYFPAQ
jgi:hypothetical protein